jgi:nucleotide-binding universal stress UspA family protein
MRHQTVRGRVVVEVDEVSDGFRVIEYAAAEALRSDARLELVRPYPDPDHREDAVQELRDAVTHVRRKLDGQVAARTIAREGSRTGVLTEVAGKARMLIVGRQRARGPYRVVASRSDLALAAVAPCPVVVVPRSWKPAVAEQPVVVGVDGTPEAVEYAFATAAFRKAQLVAVHAEPGNGDLAEALVGWQALYPDVRVSRFVSFAPVVEALMHESDQADLLVLGVRPNDPVACHALAAATCPVAMVHG